MVGFHMIAMNAERSVVVVAKIANIRQEEAIREAVVVVCHRSGKSEFAKPNLATNRARENEPDYNTRSKHHTLSLAWLRICLLC